MRRPERRASVSRALAWIPVCLLVVALSPTSASAHGMLASSVPAKDAIVEIPPERVELVFASVPTLPERDAVAVYSPQNKRADFGKPQVSGKLVSVALTAAEAGTYGVSYRTVSVDGHTQAGSFTFSVQKRSDSAALAKRLDTAGPSRSMAIAFGAARMVLLVSLLAAAGGGIFAAVIVPQQSARWLGGMLIVTIIAALVGFAFDAAIQRNVPLSGLSASALGAETSAVYGRAMVVIASLSLLALIVTRSWRLSQVGGSRPGMALLFVALAASFSLSGHAIATEPTWLRLPVDMVHLVAAAVWFGGIVQLYGMAAGAHVSRRGVERFSRAAFASVGTIVVTGSVITALELKLSPGSLLSTSYGRMVLGKLLLLAGITVLAYMNKSVYVPSLAGRPQIASVMLRQYVRHEGVLLLTVIAITAWLIQAPQPK